MPLKVTPRLRLRVEALDAIWWWEQPTATLARMAMRTNRLGLTDFDTDNPPEELVELFPAMFVEGVTEWEGVTDEDGHEIRCNVPNKIGMPISVQLQAASAYLVASAELSEKKGSSPAPPTPFTPPSESSPEGATPCPSMKQ
jgi:hypothetical protein